MLASLLVLASTPFKTCVSPDHAHLSDLSLSPDPPVHGERVSLKITTTPDIAVTVGSVTVVVTVFGIPVPGTPTYDLCTEVGVSCPLAPGKPVAASVEYGVSSHVPPGIDATISLQIKDGDGTEIGCATFEVKVSGGEGEGLLGSVERSEARRKLGAKQPPPQPQPQAQSQPQRQPTQPVEAASALARLLAAPSPAAPTPTAEQHKALLQAAYAEQPAWASLFNAWRRQQACQPQHGASAGAPQQACPAAYVPPAYANPVEEGRRFGAFKATLLRLQGGKGGRQPTDGLADQHADKTLDEMRTFAHFA